MEIVKNYLETMFANLPNTPAVLKAKNELLQMMEDKYNELIENGETPNTAVGTVISEFGNLDELAEALGISGEVAATNMPRTNDNRKMLTCDEAKKYVLARSFAGLRVGIAVMLCICSVTGPMIASYALREYTSGVGVLAMFLMIGVAVGLFIYNGVKMAHWNYIRRDVCQIDMQTANYLTDEKRKYRSTHGLLLSIGIVLCANCWLPSALSFNSQFFVRMGSVFLFLMVGIGVMLILYSSTKMKGYDKLLRVNDASTVAGNYTESQKPVYRGPIASLIMELYWPVVVCIYLTSSFLTFRWNFTGIIWPIAVGAFLILRICLRKNED